MENRINSSGAETHRMLRRAVLPIGQEYRICYGASGANIRKAIGTPQEALKITASQQLAWTRNAACMCGKG